MHTLTVPVTEVEYDVDLPKEFPEQIKGKSIAEQLDYYWALGKKDEIKPMYHANPSVYQKRRSRYSFPAPLRYDPKYHFEKLCMIKLEDVVSISEWFEDKWEDARIGFFRDYILQPILYIK